MKRHERNEQIKPEEWELIVDAPLSSDILDHSGNGNDFTAQSSGNTFNDNALYITGTNRGITLSCVDFTGTGIWDHFAIEMRVKWQNQRNCGLLALSGMWANSKNGIYVIKDSGQGYISFWQYYNTQHSWSLTLWPVNVWLFVRIEVYNGAVKVKVVREDNNTTLAELNLTQEQAGGYGNNNLRIGGGFNFSQYWNGWIKDFKLYKHV